MKNKLNMKVFNYIFFLTQCYKAKLKRDSKNF